MKLSVEQKSALRMSLLTRREWLIEFIEKNSCSNTWKNELDVIEDLIVIFYKEKTVELN